MKAAPPAPEEGASPGLLARMRRAAATGCTGLLIVCLAVLTATVFLRALVAVVEALAVLALAGSVALLIFCREWPREWSRHWQTVRDETLAWLHSCVSEKNRED